MEQLNNLDPLFSMILCIDNDNNLLIDVSVHNNTKIVKDVARVLYAVNTGVFEETIHEAMNDIKESEPNKKKLIDAIIKEYKKIKKTDQLGAKSNDDPIIDPFNVEL